MDPLSLPHPVYAQTVLAPLFEGAATHYAAHISTVNKAHLLMLSTTGIIDADAAATIANALVRAETALDEEGTEYSGEHNDYHSLLTARLNEELPPERVGMLDLARARTDVDHTVFRMALRGRVDALATIGLNLADQLLEKARDDRDTLIVTYANGQPAEPSTLGHYLCAVAEMLLGDLNRLLQARQVLDQCPMGAASGVGTGFPIDRDLMAEFLGFDAPLLNVYGGVASVDYATAVYSAVKLMALHLGRVAQEMLFWSSFEVGQLQVPDDLTEGGPANPQQRRPVAIEQMRHLASITCGRCDMVMANLVNTPFTPISDSQGDGQSAGYAAFESCARLIDLMAAVIPACRINEQRVAMTTDAACLLVGELSDTLVRDHAVGVAHARDIAAATAQEVVRSGRSLRNGYQVFSKIADTITGAKVDMSEKCFVRAVCPTRFVARRDHPGGPAPGAIADALGIYELRHRKLSQRLSQATSRAIAAQSTLLTIFATLITD